MKVEIHREPSELPPVKSVTLTLTPQEAGDLRTLCGWLDGTPPARETTDSLYSELSPYFICDKDRIRGLSITATTRLCPHAVW